MNRKIALGLPAVMAWDPHAGDDTPFTILAMDGGAIRGIITAACID